MRHDPPSPKVEQILDDHGYYCECGIDSDDDYPVYRCVSFKYDKRFAVKLIPSDGKTSAIISGIWNPHIISIYDIFTADSNDYVVQEYCSGGSLAGLIRRKQHLDEITLLQLCRDVLSGMHAAHSCNISHGNITPRCIHLDAHNRAKISGFGLSNHPKPSMAPPESQNSDDFDAFQADVWGAGMVFSKLMENCLPLTPTKSAASPLARLIGQMLWPNPEKRITLEALIANPLFAKGEKRMLQRQNLEKDFSLPPEDFRGVGQGSAWSSCSAIRMAIRQSHSFSLLLLSCSETRKETFQAIIHLDSKDGESRSGRHYRHSDV
jgi:serine/threonine protein kinase